MNNPALDSRIRSIRAFDRACPLSPKSPGRARLARIPTEGVGPGGRNVRAGDPFTPQSARGCFGPERSCRGSVVPSDNWNDRVHFLPPFAARQSSLAR
jgi:hypothetical protein